MTTSAPQAPEAGVVLPPGDDAHRIDADHDRWVSPIWPLAVASIFSPILAWAASAERADIAGYLFIAVCIMAIGLLLRRLLTLAGLDGAGSTVAVAVLIVGLTNSGLLLASFPRLLLFAGVLLFAAFAYRLRDFGPWRFIAVWGLIAAAIYPLLVTATSRAAVAPATISAPPPLSAAFQGEKRDLLILVLDGYANSAVLESIYGIDTSGFAATLESKDFEVVRDAVANYGRTRFSVASVLQLDYPVTQGALTGGDLDWLLEVIGGNNRLTAWLEQSGYRHTHVESGWFGTRCQDSVDNCVKGPWPDESLYDFTHRTFARDLSGFETGRSFTRGALHVMNWLETDLAGLLHDEIPDFIFAHVLAPHPPLFLDEGCGIRAEERFKGFTIAQPGMSTAHLQEARARYGMQVACVNQVLADVAALADETDTMAVMFGDHGPDSLGQLYLRGAEWTEEQRFERFGAMLATRVPGCDMAGVQSLVNVGRRLVSCMSDTQFPDLATANYESELTDRGERIVQVPTPEYGEGP